MVLVRGPIAGADPAPIAIALRVDRLKLAKRLWRGTADDGTEFGFELTAPLQHGDVVWTSSHARYVIAQAPEPVLVIPLDLAKPDQAAVLGWIVGNLHFVIEARSDQLLAPDDPALRQSLQRLGIGFHSTMAVFQPHRLAAAVAHSHAPAPAANGREHPFIRPPQAAGV